MLDWLIIGGGIQGTTLANYLIHRYGASAERVRILDPHPHLLTQWTRRTHNIGMQHLRSPWVHHLDIEPMSLDQFRQANPSATYPPYIPPFNRPAYRLFQDHCQHIVEQRGLQALHLQGEARGMVSTKGGYVVETDQGALRALRVILALGRTHLRYPSWWVQAERVAHIFDPSFMLDVATLPDQVTVLGAGITAGQVALTLLGANKRVTLLSRGAIRVHDLDSSPCWVGVECSKQFKREKSYLKRRTMIQQARHVGSMSADIAKRVHTLIAKGRLQHLQGEVLEIESYADGVRLALQDGSDHASSFLIVATGFESQRPGGEWLEALIDWFGLTVAPCGYPIVNAQLEWAKGLHVAGALAELEIGPPSANIVGARLIAERLRSLV
jgi:pyruvate/2-oxoglutarate dehydrogenase complex dihydrolipoamide dehydrogenase (E3) component